MKIRFLSASLMVSVLFIVPSLSAEIYQCDGKWTNRPCEGEIERTIHEKTSVVVEDGGSNDAAETVSETAADDGKKDVALEPLAPRYSISRRLKKLSKELTQKYQIGLTKDELHAFEERCINRENTLAQCQSEYDVLAQRLNSKVAEKTKK